MFLSLFAIILLVPCFAFYLVLLLVSLHIVVVLKAQAWARSASLFLLKAAPRSGAGDEAQAKFLTLLQRREAAMLNERKRSDSP